MKKQNRAEFAPQLKVEEFPPTSSFEPAETPRKPEEEVDNSGSEYTQGDETMDMAILQELIKDDEKSLELFIRDNDKAVDYITQGDLPNALSMLEKMEKLMEYIAMNGRVLDRNIIIVCLYNIASAYQASWQLAKCAKYIEAVTYNIAQSIIHDEAVINAKAPKNYEDPQINGLRAITLRKKQFLVKVYLQYCAVASQLNKHDEALAIGHKAHGVMCSIIEQCLEFCQEVNKSIELDTKSLVSPQKANDRSRVTTSGSSSDLKKNMLSEITFRDEIYYNKHIVDSAMPFLEDFLKNTQEFSRVKMDEIVRTTRNLLFNWKNNPENNEKYMRKELSKDKMPIQVADENRSLLGVQHDPEWLTTLNIGSIMHMRPLRYKDYSQKRELINELTKTSLQEKAVFQSLSFFTLATEMRFVEANKDPLPQTEGDTKSKEKSRVPGTYKISEAYHLKSIEVICRYITGPCPYINHLITSYQKHYGQDLETILEESMHSFNDSTVSKDLVIEDQLRITPGKMEAVIRDPVNRLQLVSKKSLKKANSSQERPKPALSERSEFVRNMEAERYKELKKDRKKETIKSVNIRGKKLSGKDANTNRLHTNSLSVSSPTRNSNIEFTMVSPKLHKTIMRCDTDSDSVEDKLSGKKSPVVPTLGLNTILLKEVASPTLSKKASQGSSNGNTGFRSERGPPHHKPEPMSSFNASETERRSKELLQSEPTFYMHKNFNKFIQNYYIKTEQALQQRIVEEKIKEKFMKHPFQKEISPQKSKRLLTKKPNSSQMVSPPQPRTPLPGKTFDLSPLKKSLPGDLMKKIENKRPKTANKRGPSNESGSISHIRGNSANLRLSEKLMKALNTKEADYIKRNGLKK